MFNIEWEKPVKKADYIYKRDYDVKITLNKSGTADNGAQRFAIRFGFLNNGAKVVPAGKYVEVSSPINTRRLYFRVTDAKNSALSHKIIRNNANSEEGAGTFATLTPRVEGAEKAYRIGWVGKDFKLQYDDENKLYYIEKDN